MKDAQFEISNNMLYAVCLGLEGSRFWNTFNIFQDLMGFVLFRAFFSMAYSYYFHHGLIVRVLTGAQMQQNHQRYEEGKTFFIQSVT